MTSVYLLPSAVVTTTFAIKPAGPAWAFSTLRATCFARFDLWGDINANATFDEVVIRLTD